MINLIVHVSVHYNNNVHIHLAKTRDICSHFRANPTKCVELAITHLQKLYLVTRGGKARRNRPLYSDEL